MIKQSRITSQQSPTQKPSPRLIIKAPKMSIFNKRSSSEALGANNQQDTLKKMRFTSPSPIIDLEEEEHKENMCMEMVDTKIQNEEINTENKPQNEGNMKVFSSRKHIFGQTSGMVYQSKEDLLHQYVVKGSMDNSEIKEILPKVEGTSQRKAHLLSVRDVEKKTFNIAVADNDKVFEFNVHYENLDALDKVKFHINVSDMLYADYLKLALKVVMLTAHVLKLDG
jgi:hypothetical protein